ncbi:lysophospholipid acyltransferase family protein [Deinococcus peraridilitoris]|uniref:1-acyl-sn-glycerol-3-phosphate acyltransferase n=1 Tax=Deinococcus peraridilitoris (strain DSM 19664 / LMG 22246 / CIP 109416 / KR-200) TaxID=937777 RepID=L0A0J4_DEIPD|nr:lysophospholipid acyltransferase family protein [Deinococcus peraridilitoris]AFZ67366.1 1-acyl-sn-glycerol-3-phosphate acyltransferase [Deinococcus peraridilitoris DSM 19664]
MTRPKKATQGQAASNTKRINPVMYELVQLATGIPILLGGGLNVEGREHIPRQGRVVIAGSHTLSLDPFAISHAMPRGRRIQYMAKKELFDNPFLGFVIGTGGSFPVDRTGNDVGAIRTALRILQAEGALGIFPQGTRGGTALQGGAALIALKGKAPIVPASVRYDRAKRRWFVRFGPPIAPEGKVAELTEKIREALRTLE